MSVRNAQAVWEGNLKDGNGTMKLGSGAWEGKYSFSTRFEEEPGTNPEELIGAAEAGCFSMAFANELDKAGFAPRRVQTKAQVEFGRVDGKPRITEIRLDTEADVPNISEDKFQEIASATKSACPISVALQAVTITLNARLVK